jgi:hypothetical protein
MGEVVIRVSTASFFNVRFIDSRQENTANRKNDQSAIIRRQAIPP